MRIIGLLKITSLEKMSLFELCTLEVIENNLHISCDQNPELNEERQLNQRCHLTFNCEGLILTWCDGITLLLTDIRKYNRQQDVLAFVEKVSMAIKQNSHKLANKHNTWGEKSSTREDVKKDSHRKNAQGDVLYEARKNFCTSDSPSTNMKRNDIGASRNLRPKDIYRKDITGEKWKEDPSQITDENRDLDVIPFMNWGGYYWDKGRKMILQDTCPIDNFLLMFCVWLGKNKSAFQRMKIDANVKENLNGSITLIKQRLFGEAKATWMQSFPDFPTKFISAQNPNVVKLFGNEFNQFVSKLKPMMMTSCDSTCSNEMCPKPVRHYTSNFIMLSLPNVRKMEENYLQAMFREWLSPDDEHCSETLSITSGKLPKPKAKLYVTDEFGNTTEEHRCPGLRSSSERKFVHGIPPFLLFEVDFFTRHPDNSIRLKTTEVPEELLILGSRFHLAGSTLFAREGQHYVCRFNCNGAWYHYDALSNVKRCTGLADSEANFSMSTLIYRNR